MAVFAVNIALLAVFYMITIIILILAIVVCFGADTHRHAIKPAYIADFFATEGLADKGTMPMMGGAVAIICLVVVIIAAILLVVVMLAQSRGDEEVTNAPPAAAARGRGRGLFRMMNSRSASRKMTNYRPNYNRALTINTIGKQPKANSMMFHTKDQTQSPEPNHTISYKTKPNFLQATSAQTQSHVQPQNIYGHSRPEPPANRMKNVNTQQQQQSLANSNTNINNYVLQQRAANMSEDNKKRQIVL